MESTLNKRQARFVEEYLVDSNATQAAIRAGYSERTAYQAGHRLLRHGEIMRQLQQANAKRSEKLEITRDMVLLELLKILQADPRGIMEWTEDGAVLKPSDQLTDAQAASIQSISSRPTKNGVSWTVKQHDKVRAAELIMRYLPDAIPNDVDDRPVILFSLCGDS